jgi:hypothetical protein
MLPHHHLGVFFAAVAECAEEAILNAVTSAETMVGHKGHTAHALPAAGRAAAGDAKIWQGLRLAIRRTERPVFARGRAGRIFFQSGLTAPADTLFGRGLRA